MLLALSLLALPAWAQQCKVAGDKARWIADFCKAELETDDAAQAAPCIAKESRKHFANECAARIYYKRQLCRLAVERKARAGSLQSCEADARFTGAAVRKGAAGR